MPRRPRSRPPRQGLHRQAIDDQRTGLAPIRSQERRQDTRGADSGRLPFLEAEASMCGRTHTEIPVGVAGAGSLSSYDPHQVVLSLPDWEPDE
jgi:hypothetical protein